MGLKGDPGERHPPTSGDSHSCSTETTARMLIDRAPFHRSPCTAWLLTCDGPPEARPGGSATLYSAGTPWFSQDRQTNRDKSPQELMWLFPCHELVPRVNLPSRGRGGEQSYSYSPPLSVRWTLWRDTTCFCVHTEPAKQWGLTRL